MALEISRYHHFPFFPYLYKGIIQYLNNLSEQCFHLIHVSNDKPTSDHMDTDVYQALCPSISQYLEFSFFLDRQRQNILKVPNGRACTGIYVVYKGAERPNDAAESTKNNSFTLLRAQPIDEVHNMDKELSAMYILIHPQKIYMIHINLPMSFLITYVTNACSN